MLVRYIKALSATVLLACISLSAKAQSGEDGFLPDYPDPTIADHPASHSFGTGTVALAFVLVPVLVALLAKLFSKLEPGSGRISLLVIRVVAALNLIGGLLTGVVILVGALALPQLLSELRFLLGVSFIAEALLVSSLLFAMSSLTENVLLIRETLLPAPSGRSSEAPAGPSNAPAKRWYQH